MIKIGIQIMSEDINSLAIAISLFILGNAYATIRILGFYLYYKYNNRKYKSYEIEYISEKFSYYIWSKGIDFISMLVYWADLFFVAAFLTYKLSQYITPFFK